MLKFYHDANLTVSNKQNNPKRFLSPLKGLANKLSVIYMADVYQANLTAVAAVSAGILNLTKTDEFLTSGTAQVNSNGNLYTITYTGKTASSLTGVSGVTTGLNIGDVVKPWKIYKSNGNFTFTPRGVDLTTVQISLGVNSGNYNFPGSVAIFGTGSYDTIVDQSVPLYISAGCLAGVEQEFNNWVIASNPIYVRDKNDNSPILPAEVGNTITCYGSLDRRDNFQVSSLRLLPSDRLITANSPGFILGSYRWRDQSNVNSQIVIPTRWDTDIDAIGTDNFISGIGSGNDLAPIDIENVDNSIYLRIKNGFYFAGPTRYFLPANPQITFVNAVQTGIFLPLSPNVGTPVFVGRWILDSNKFYRVDINFRYQASNNFNTSTDAPTYQYTLNKQTNLLNLNQTLQPEVYFLGLLSGEKEDYFDLPVYPVDSVSSVYVDRGIGNATLPSNNFYLDRNLGTLTVTAPIDGIPTSIPGALVGEPVYAVCNPAYAVVYDSGDSDQRVIDEVDLNPAFSGISSGYVYLQHRRQEPVALTIAADKPIIDIPATFTSIIDLVAYGPIYFDGDYSLLTVTAFGPLGNEIIPNAKVKIVPGANFSGSINYQDPTSTEVIGTTGSDGKVNFLYLPDPNYGYYIPTTPSSSSLAGLATTHNANDTIVLPMAIPIDEVYNTKEGWLVGTYNITNTDPLFGLVSGDISKGQLPFMTLGNPGTSNYKTNGEKVLWANGNVGINPIDARDENGNSYTNNSFNGLVVSLVYSTSLLTTSNIGAYFVNTLQRVSLQVELVDSNIISNTILLEMALGNPINQNPWLYLDSSTSGRLNQYRLGWQQDLPNSL